jgi:hypothetical protein
MQQAQEIGDAANHGAKADRLIATVTLLIRSLARVPTMPAAAPRHFLPPLALAVSV